MKIEVDLLAIQAQPMMGRVAAVAILQALPVDEAQLAVEQWQALTYALADEDQPAAEEVRQPPQPEPAQPAPAAPPAPVTPGTAVVPGPASGGAEATPEPPVCGATTAIDALHPHLSNKTIGALTRAGFRTLGDLVTKTPEILLSGVDRFGQKGLTELTAVMEAAGLSLGSEPAAERAGPPTPRADGTLEDEAPAEQPAPPELDLAQPNGHAPELPLRDFLRNAEHHLGRPKVIEIMQAHGVTKIADVGANEPDLRVAIEAEMP